MADRKYDVQPLKSASKYDAQPLAPKPPEEPEDTTTAWLKPTSRTGAAARGLSQGVTLGFGDEAMGAVDAASEFDDQMKRNVGILPPREHDATPAVNPTTPHIEKSWKPSAFGRKTAEEQAREERATIPEDDSPMPSKSLGELYRKARWNYNQDNLAAKTEHPWIYGGSELVGNIAAPVPGPKGVGFLNKVKSAAATGLGTGLVSGAGRSDTDLTQASPSQVAQFVADTTTSGALGALGGVAGQAVASGAGALASRFGSKAAEISAARAAAKLEAAEASASAAANQKKQVAYRIYEDLMNRIKDPNANPLKVREAEEWLASKEGQELAQSVFANKIKDAPQAIGAWKEKVADLARVPEEVAAENAAYFAKNTLGADVLPRVAHYAKPAIAAAIGGAVAGPVGAGAGGLLGAASGKPGRAIANLVRTPRFQAQFLDLLASGTEGLGSVFGASAPAIASQRTPEAREALATKAMEDPEVAAKVQAEVERRTTQTSTPVKKSWDKFGSRFGQ